MQYIYITVFLLSMPLVWNVLYCLHFDHLFKAEKTFQIKIAYIIVTLIASHLVAEAFYTFSNAIYGLFK